MRRSSDSRGERFRAPPRRCLWSTKVAFCVVLAIQTSVTSTRLGVTVKVLAWRRGTSASVDSDGSSYLSRRGWASFSQAAPTLRGLHPAGRPCRLWARQQHMSHPLPRSLSYRPEQRCRPLLVSYGHCLSGDPRLVHAVKGCIWRYVFAKSWHLCPEAGYGQQEGKCGQTGAVPRLPNTRPEIAEPRASDRGSLPLLTTRAVPARVLQVWEMTPTELPVHMTEVL